MDIIVIQWYVNMWSGILKFSEKIELAKNHEICMPHLNYYQNVVSIS